MQSTLASRRWSLQTPQMAVPSGATSATLPQRSQGRIRLGSSVSTRPSSAATSPRSPASQRAKRCAVFSPTPGRRANRSTTRARRAGSMKQLLPRELEVLHPRAQNLDGVGDARMVLHLGEGRAAQALGFLRVERREGRHTGSARRIALDRDGRGRSEMLARDALDERGLAHDFGDERLVGAERDDDRAGLGFEWRGAREEGSELVASLGEERNDGAPGGVRVGGEERGGGNRAGGGSGAWGGEGWGDRCRGRARARARARARGRGGGEGGGGGRGGEAAAGGRAVTGRRGAVPAGGGGERPGLGAGAAPLRRR